MLTLSDNQDAMQRLLIGCRYNMSRCGVTIGIYNDQAHTDEETRKTAEDCLLEWRQTVTCHRESGYTAT